MNIELSCAAVLFDMDGVLVDSQAVVRRTWRRWSESRGLDATSVLSTAHGRRTVDTLQIVAPALDTSADEEWLEAAELVAREGIAPVAGAKELVARLPDGRWAVVTSAGRELARRRLEWAGLPMPSCLVSADQVNRGKPAPEAYLRAAAALRAPPPECLVIEDAPAGVQAARAAGMRVIGLTTTCGADAMPPVEALLPDLLGIEVRLRDDALVLRIDRRI